MGILDIDLLGTKFTIKADEDTEYLKTLLIYYTKMVEQIKRDTEADNQTQISIIAGIMLCDELYKEKIQLNKYKKQPVQQDYAEAERITLKMLNDLDRVLE